MISKETLRIVLQVAGRQGCQFPARFDAMDRITSAGEQAGGLAGAAAHLQNAAAFRQPAQRDDAVDQFLRIIRTVFIVQSRQPCRNSGCPFFFRWRILSTILFLLPPKIPIPDRHPDGIQMFQQSLGIAAAGLEKVAYFGQADLSFLPEGQTDFLFHCLIIRLAENHLVRDGHQVTEFQQGGINILARQRLTFFDRGRGIRCLGELRHQPVHFDLLERVKT